MTTRSNKKYVRCHDTPHLFLIAVTGIEIELQSGVTRQFVEIRFKRGRSRIFDTVTALLVSALKSDLRYTWTEYLTEGTMLA